MAQGIVKWFNDAKGYGFISRSDDGKDVFVHYSSISGEGFRTLNQGQTVEYFTSFSIEAVANALTHRLAANSACLSVTDESGDTFCLASPSSGVTGLSPVATALILCLPGSFAVFATMAPSSSTPAPPSSGTSVRMYGSTLNVPHCRQLR